MKTKTSSGSQAGADTTVVTNHLVLSTITLAKSEQPVKTARKGRVCAYVHLYGLGPRSVSFQIHAMPSIHAEDVLGGGETLLLVISYRDTDWVLRCCAVV